MTDTEQNTTSSSNEEKKKEFEKLQFGQITQLQVIKIYGKRGASPLGNFENLLLKVF